MAKGVNKVFLLGNVGKDPEFRATGSGMQVCNFSLATPDRAKGADGQWTDKAEWHNIICFDKIAEVVKNYVKKGSQILVEGKIQNRSWDDKTTGQKRYITEIIVNDLTLLGGRGGESGGGQSGSYASSNARASSTSGYTQSQPAAAPSYGNEGITDDDIPF